jgi:hypothetical protein
MVIWVAAALPLRAEISAEMQRLSIAMGLPDIINVMHDEGVEYGGDLAESMFPGRGGETWQQTVAEIYDVARMADVALSGFGEALDVDNISDLTDFFESPLGVEIIALEISAREALMDDALDEANKANTASMIANRNPRIDMIQEFIVVNDLLETNIVGALNSNVAFFSGLVDGGAYDTPITEEKILSDVMAQEPEIRIDTGEWLFGFLTMAYSPLSDEDLAAYIAFSETEAGQALNTALFVGFDELFELISHDLGMAAAAMMGGQEL